LTHVNFSILLPPILLWIFFFSFTPSYCLPFYTIIFSHFSLLTVRIRPYPPTFSIHNFLFSLFSTTMTDASSSIVVPTPHATITTAAITIHNSITHKLSKDNYRLWKATIVPILRGHSVYGFVDGTIKPPPQTIEVVSTTNGVETIEKKSNPEFATWNQQDQLILGALTSSLTESILTYVLKCTTSRDLWFTLERMFTSHSQARLMQVHLQLATLKKGDSSISDYFQKFTSLVDTLAAVDQPLNDFELTAFLLAGLGSDYDSFVTSVTTRVTPMTLDDLYGHLLAHEHRLFRNTATLDVAPVDANFVAKNRPHRGRGGRNSSSNFTAGRGGRYYQQNHPPYQFGN
jgi:hypothetical protein